MAENAQCSSSAGSSDRHVSVHALRTKTRTILSSLLNPVKVLPTDTGLPRDWKGLAELVGIGGERIPQMHNELDPTVKVLNLWCEIDRNNSTVAKLLEHLEALDRFDVIDDVTAFIDEDIRVFRERSTRNPASTSLSTSCDDSILTVDDVTRVNQGLQPQQYDAFVLFADDDIDFATQLIDTLEKTYQLKMCVKDRDLVGGAIELDVIVRLIAERCNRLVVIISQSFFQSHANKYFVSFAQSIGIEQRQRKIIPCIYSTCKIPPELSCYFMLDYSKAGKLWNFWDKLNDSIQVTKSKPGRAEVARSVSMQVRPRPDALKPALHHSVSQSNGVRPKQRSNPENNVKFSSKLNVLGSSKELVNGNSAASVNGTCVSSSNSISTEFYSNGDSKKSKSLISMFKKIMPKHNSRKLHVMETDDSTIAPNGAQKRNFWNRRVKRKAAMVN